jgi:hypothetical protein
MSDQKMRTNYPSAFKKPEPEVIRDLNRLHEEYVLVPADKACNNIVFVCMAHYHQCIINELGINSTIDNRTYSLTTFSKDEILQDHAPVLNTLNIPGHVDDDSELPYLYWIPKLHKTPYKQRSMNNCVPPLCEVHKHKRYNEW